MKVLTITKDVKSIIAKQPSSITSLNLTEVMSTLNIAKTKLKEITTIRKQATAPLELQIKTIEIEYTPSEKALKTFIEAMGAQVSAYQTKLVSDRQAEEIRISERIGTGRGKLKVETAVAKIEQLDEVEMKGFRKIQVLKILYKEMIPEKYLIPNEPLILEDLKKGVKIEGCEIEVKLIAVNRP